MRRLSLFVSAVGAVGVMGLALGPGCQDATQVTVDIALAKRASCTETNGTAITVGTEPTMTEKRVTDEFVTATTNSCTEATHEIGTLVVTPGGGGRGSIVVVVAYDKTIVPSSCKPPLYKGCIVARRRFTFSDHQQLRLPITIDPECKDVPCDAFSTCRTGKCFDSATGDCGGEVCGEPGDPGDGGTSADGQVTPDTGVDSPIGPVDGGTDAPTDSSTDGGNDGSTGSDAADASDGAPGNGAPGCSGGMLMCPTPTLCGGTNQACCGLLSSAIASCNTLSSSCQAGMKKYCCGDGDCVFPQTCFLGVSGPLPAAPNGPLPAPNPLTPAGTCQ